jgi:hypothetical protein
MNYMLERFFRHPQPEQAQSQSPEIEGSKFKEGDVVQWKPEVIKRVDSTARPGSLDSMLVREGNFEVLGPDATNPESVMIKRVGHDDNTAFPARSQSLELAS